MTGIGYCLLDNTNSFCTDTRRCDVSGLVCAMDGDCPPLEFCIAFNGTCALQTPECIDECYTPQLRKFPDCPTNLPTLGQWGLILLTLALVSGMIFTLRRRGLPTHVAASMLMLLAIGVGAAGVSYSAIQSERTCYDNDVAVEFVDNLLKG